MKTPQQGEDISIQQGCQQLKLEIDGCREYKAEKDEFHRQVSTQLEELDYRKLYSSLKKYFEEEVLHGSSMVREMMDEERFMEWNAPAGEEKCMDMEEKLRKHLTGSRAWEPIRRSNRCETMA